MWREGWREGARGDAEHLAGITPGGLPEALGRAAAIGRALGLPQGAPKTEENYRGRAIHGLAAAVAVALADRGWSISALPGEPIVLEGAGEQRLRPFEEVPKLAGGELVRERWVAAVQRAGIAEVELSKLGRGATPGEPATARRRR